jgi:fatty-acyl-CoA synthase
MTTTQAALPAGEAARRECLCPEGAYDRLARRQSLGEMLDRSATRFGDKLALAFCGTEWGYSDLNRIVTRLASGLLDAGLQPGDRIAVLARNSHWYVALRFATARAGLVFVPINFMLNASDAAYILGHCEPAMLFLDATTLSSGIAAAAQAGVTSQYLIPTGKPDAAIPLPSIEILLAPPAALPTVDGRSVAQIIYTSGTESRPKGAMITHEAVLWQIQSCVTDCRWQSDSVQLNAMPLFHCAQLDAFLAPSIQVGGSNLIVSGPAPDIVIPMIERHRVTSFFAPPVVWISLLRSPAFATHDLSSLRQGFYGASIMPSEVLKELQQRLPDLGLYNCYGQTEITCVATTLKPEDQIRKAGSAGKPVLHVETRIVDDDMHEMPPGEIGEIVHRSPQLLTGYWRDPEKTATAFAGGWFHSGDLGVMDPEGFITVVDRKKDMIKSGGENVSSREVEDILYRIPAVAEAAVIGLPHPRWIEAVTAVIVLKQGMALSENDVVAHCSAALSRFKVPKQVVFVEHLPRNASGKILKRDLRSLAAADA